MYTEGSDWLTNPLDMDRFTMTQANSMDLDLGRKFDPTVGWISLIGCIVIVASIRLVWHSAPHVTPVEQIRFYVDINSASQAELMVLPNVGPETASKILEYRRQHGPFLDVEQLLRVPGVGPQTLKSLKPIVFVRPSDEADISLAKN